MYLSINQINKLLICVSILIFSVSCKKEEERKLPPAINFKINSIYTQNNDTAAIGAPLRFGIQARGSSTEITNFVIKKVFPNNSYTVIMDTGLYSMSLDIDKIFYQNIEEEVKWTFIVMDKNRLSSEISLTVYKDPNSQFGGILFYPSIKMGYQKNIEFGQFLSLNSGQVYFEDSAQIMQQDIDVLTYYIVDDNLPSPVLSSSGEYDNYSTEAASFYTSIPSWTTRNFTLWDISVDNNPISSEDFDNCHNDSLLIVSYNDVWGKKKFKWATSRKIIPFQTSKGKKGLLRIIHADEFDTGKIEFSIKMQL
ncbi:MAG: hypothetical protein K9J13_04210 [Saprospiraceae bacterium]|nr:hypothetical protein [Saprospiraceae bacterium]